MICTHNRVSYSCVGHSLFKTCQDCCGVFTIGNTIDLARTCLDKPESEQDEFIKQVTTRFYGSNFQAVVKHERTKREFNIQQKAFERLAS